MARTSTKPPFKHAKPPLQIFLSHKLGKSREKAKRVASALSVLADDKMIITYSADFDRGEEWERRIREGLDNADWFILLYDGPDVNHDWCLWEGGYFRANMKTRPDRKLICIHDPRHSLPGPLRGFASVPARSAELQDLFDQIYLSEPWSLRPQLYKTEDGRREIGNKINQIIQELSGEELIAQFTISPTFTFHVRTNDLDSLQKGQIPPNTSVMGDGPWEAVFGRPHATVAWSWNKLTMGMLDWQPWAHQLACMMYSASKYENLTHPSIALRIKLREDKTESVYRVILRRLEKTAEELRFTFAAAKVITSYQANSRLNETRVFHLYNMAWFFRHHFLEKHLNALNDLMLPLQPDEAAIAEEIRLIEDDLKALHAEAQVRGVEDPVCLIKAFEGQPIQAEIRTSLLQKWPELAAELKNACEAKPANLQRVISAIESMRPMNNFFIKNCLMLLGQKSQSQA